MTLGALCGRVTNIMATTKIRVPTELHRKLKELAVLESSTMVELLGRMVEYYSAPPETKKEVTVEEAIKKIAVEEVPWEGESEFPQELEIPEEEPVEETGNLFEKFTEENLQLMNMSTLEAARYLREKKERESE